MPAELGGQFINYVEQDNIGQYVANRIGRNSISNYLFVNNGVYANTSDVPIDPVTGLRMRSEGNLTGYLGYLQSYQGGDAILYDANGDYVIDYRDRQVTGNTQPLITGGFFNTFVYGQFSLNIAATFTAFRSIMNNALAYRMTQLSAPFDAISVPAIDGDKMWRGPGDNRATYANAYNYAHEAVMGNFRPEQTLWQENGSYLKINSATFSYSVPKKSAKRLGVNGIRTYVSSSNLWTISPYSGPNPESVTSLGKDLSGMYPNPRTYTLGLNVTF